MQQLLTEILETRFFAFDREAATAYAFLVRRAMASGFSIGVADYQFAATSAVCTDSPSPLETSHLSSPPAVPSSIRGQV